MVNHLRKYTCVLLFLASLWATVACEEKPYQITIPAFDRAKDLALVCYDTNDKITLPIDCCRKDGVPVDANCGVGLPYADLFAFVTQTTMGEVAIVSMRNLTVIDQETSIPYTSFIPVGGQPNDIVATNDGSKVITANYETGDLSLIDIVQNGISVIDDPSISPTLAIDLGGAAARIGLVARPSAFGDRFILVTQPVLGRVALVAIDETVCGGSQGCMVGYLSLREVAEDEADAGVEDEDGGVDGSSTIRPWAIEMSENTPSAFIGILGAPLGQEIVQIDTEVMISEALASYDSSSSDPVELSDNGIIRYLDTNGKEVAELSLEPEVEKWMYGIDYNQGDLFVINLRENELETLEDGSTSIELTGQAIALKLFRHHETGLPSPATFDGTFAVVSTTYASIFVIDVDDENEDTQYPHQHSIRSATDFIENPPAIPSEVPPEVWYEGDPVPEDEAADFIYFENDNTGDEDTDTETDTDTEQADAGPDLPDCDDVVDGGVLFKPDYDHGFRFRCDSRESKNDVWTMIWEGTVGINGAVVLVDEDVDGQVHVRDESTDFCNRGLKVDIRVPGAEPDEPGGGSGQYENYLGDVLVITSEPTPANENSDCSFFENPDDTPAMYKVEKVLGTNDLLLNNSLPFYGPNQAAYQLPTEECFGQAFSYEIRMHRHWTIVGNSTGRLRDTGVFDPETETCIPDPGWDELRTQRVIPGVQFANLYFTFKLLHGINYNSEYGGFENTTEEDDTGAEEGDFELPNKAAVEFQTYQGFSPLASVVGSNITDIELTPENFFLFVDQAQLGLILFNIIGSPFGPVGNSVN